MESESNFNYVMGNYYHEKNDVFMMLQHYKKSAEDGCRYGTEKLCKYYEKLNNTIIKKKWYDDSVVDIGNLYERLGDQFKIMNDNNNMLKFYDL